MKRTGEADWFDVGSAKLSEVGGSKSPARHPAPVRVANWMALSGKPQHHHRESGEEREDEQDVECIVAYGVVHESLQMPNGGMEDAYGTLFRLSVRSATDTRNIFLRDVRRRRGALSNP
jgi:hypothetical protein